MASGAKAVKTAFFVNLVISIMKLAAAFVTKSAGMMAEAIHSFADAGNQILLLIGIKRSAKPVNDLHPFGYGKEEYFWSFIVAMLLFVLGGVYSLYEGIHKIIHPEDLKHVYINFIILGISVALEGYSWWVAKKAMDRAGTGSMLTKLVDSKDANTVVVFVEDTAALVGLVTALAGTLLAFLTGNPVYDAISSVAIGALLFVVAIFLANEMRKLLVGETIDPALANAARILMVSHNALKDVYAIKTMQLGLNACIFAADVDFKDHLGDREIEKAVEELRESIRTIIPQAKYIYLQSVGKKEDI